jgi:hypothetical protein
MKNIYEITRAYTILSYFHNEFLEIEGSLDSISQTEYDQAIIVITTQIACLRWILDYNDDSLFDNLINT